MCAQVSICNSLSSPSKDVNLVHIRTEEENLFIRNEIKRVLGSEEKIWIGLMEATGPTRELPCSTATPGRVFKWIDDGSGITEFIGWRTTEPNNHGGNENCVHFRRGNWNDDKCTALAMAVRKYTP